MNGEQQAAQIISDRMDNPIHANAIVKALAAAGLLLTDADRAVLDAAERQTNIGDEPHGTRPYEDWDRLYSAAADRTEDAVRARREAPR